jgi:hypothetical protein
MRDSMTAKSSRWASIGVEDKPEMAENTARVRPTMALGAPAWYAGGTLAITSSSPTAPFPTTPHPHVFPTFAHAHEEKARPYILVCGGYWSQWVVDLDYDEDVLGFGGGAGVEMEIDRTKRLFFDVRYIEGQTRKYQEGINVDESNTVIIPARLGVTWEIR